MKTKLSNQRTVLHRLGFLVCGLIACGCNPRLPKAPVENQLKVETQSPAIESALPQSDPGSTSADIASPLPADPVVKSTKAVTNPADVAVPTQVPETWSVQRILALSAHGPIVIDLSVNIGGKSLDEAAESATSRAIATIAKDLEKPWTWPKLLDHPLIRSGWLGNLVANKEQSEQLIAMYNKDGDDEVEEEELPAFLTRGLARDGAFRFSDIGFAPGAAASRSPWEQLDPNQDSSLDQSEIANINKVVASLDLNADHIVTLAEMQTSRSTMAAQNAENRKTAVSAISLDANSKSQKVFRKVLEKYNSFDAPLSRDQWPDWGDKRWDFLDKDHDRQVTVKELESIATVQPTLDLKIKFYNNAQAECSIAATVESESDFAWNSRRSTAGQATGKSGAISVVVTDSFTDTNRAKLRTQLALALTDPQIASFIRTQLNLGDNAFELLDADNDDKLSDEEFDNAWEWLSAIRGSRILARWMIAESAWFRLVDTDADGRITEFELEKFKSYLTKLDQDKDGIVSPVEMPTTTFFVPMAIRVDIVRADDRLGLNFPTDSQKPTTEVGWFAASDSNNDSVISNSEFLGSNDDFSAYDTDKDGFISATEAYKNPATRVQ